MMLGKRQRADSELSNPMLGGSSILPTPTRCSTQHNTQFTHDNTPPHLSSRTRKRIRDNRPAEETIHGTTTIPQTPTSASQTAADVFNRKHPEHALRSTETSTVRASNTRRCVDGDWDDAFALSTIVTTFLLVATYSPSQSSFLLSPISPPSTNRTTHAATRSNILFFV